MKFASACSTGRTYVCTKPAMFCSAGITYVTMMLPMNRNAGMTKFVTKDANSENALSSISPTTGAACWNAGMSVLVKKSPMACITGPSAWPSDATSPLTLFRNSSLCV